MSSRRRARVVAGLVAGAMVAAAGVWAGGGSGDVVVGRTDATTSTPLPGPEIVVETTVAPPPPPEPAAADPGGGPAVGLTVATGRPFGEAIAFRSDIAVPDSLQFVLVIGSDARPGQNVRNSRADSIHLLAVDPATRQGTVVGFPRDSWVEIPGRGRAKINDALARGGPRLMVETVRRLSGLPIDYYVLTGFRGLPGLVDDLGGVDVFVERRMNDAASGARFQPGWHHFDGAQALAYARDRLDVPGGDFGRSANQGNLILAALGKMRSEVGDDAGLLGWLGVLRRHVELDVPAGELPALAALARGIDPRAVANVVLPGRSGSAGGASVVYLTADAAALFVDLRDDAVVNRSARAPVASTPTAPPTTPPTTEPDPLPETTTTTTVAEAVASPSP